MMQDVSLFRPILIFVALLAVAQAIIVVLGVVFPDVQVPTFVNFLIVILAAMACGRVFAHTAERPPTRGETVLFSAIGVLMGLFVNVVFLAGLLISQGIPATGDMLAQEMIGAEVARDERAGFLVTGLALAFAIGLVLAIAGFGTGARQALKTRRAA